MPLQATSQPTPTTPIRAVRIGIDGGGTKTDFILIDDASGRLLAQRRAPGCSPSHLDKETIYRLITENIAALLGEVAEHSPAPNSNPQPTITHCVLCTAGAPPFWHELAAELAGGPIPLGQIHSFDDSLPVLELATGGGPGLVLHSGTGSFVAARGPDLQPHYAGGLGWRIGDQGSAYDLGKRAAERALLELQGWARPSCPSPLGKAVCEQLGIHAADALLQHIYDTPASGAVGTAVTLSSLAPLVTALEAQGDPTAAEVLRCSVYEFARLAHAVSECLFGETEDAAWEAQAHNDAEKNRAEGREGRRALRNARPLPPLRVGLSGPILQSETAQHVVAQVLGPRHQLHLITQPPTEGLRQLLARL